MTTSTDNAQPTKMSGKLRTLGITLFGIVELLKWQGIDLGVNQDDIYSALELIAGVIAGVGAAISWGKLIYRNFFKKN